MFVTLGSFARNADLEPVTVPGELVGLAAWNIYDISVSSVQPSAGALATSVSRSMTAFLQVWNILAHVTSPAGNFVIDN